MLPAPLFCLASTLSSSGRRFAACLMRPSANSAVTPAWHCMATCMASRSFCIAGQPHSSG
jgi:hypothetical protein